MIGQLLLALSILIIFHEWGHFQTARWFGIKVEKFYLFFDAWGQKLFSFKKGDTEYGVGWLPLGGYVKISGMIDESMDKEFLDKEPEDWEFRAKPVWQRLIVMLGGVTVNIILGVIIYSGIKFVYGEKYQTMEMASHGIVAHELGEEVGFKTGDYVLKINGEKPERFDDLLRPEILMTDAIFTVKRGDSILDIQLPLDFAGRMKDKAFMEARVQSEIGELVESAPAKKVGLLEGDLIKTVDGKPSLYFDQIKAVLQDLKGKTVPLVYERNGREQQLEIAVTDEGTIGFRPHFEFATETFGFGESLVEGSKSAFGLLALNIKGFGKMFRGEINASKSVAGPIGIARMFGSVWDWHKFWSLTAALSMILAFMNIIPIPALDGGHVFFLLIEWVRGKPLSDKALERAQIAGFIILVALMVLIFGNDIYRAIVD